MRKIRNFPLSLISLLMLILLSACGAKGDLYQQPKEAQPSAAPQPQLEKTTEKPAEPTEKSVTHEQSV